MSLNTEQSNPGNFVAKAFPGVAKAFHDLISSKFPSGSVIHIQADPPDANRYHIEIWDDHTLLYYVQPDGMTYIAKAFFDGRVGFYGDSEEACEKRAVAIYKGALEYYQLLETKGPMNS